MIPSSGCPPWPPDHPRTLPRTGTPTPPRGARPIGPNVGPVVLSRRAEDPHVSREIILCQRGHHAAGARAGDAQAHRITNHERTADPGILHEVRPVISSL